MGTNAALRPDGRRSDKGGDSFLQISCFHHPALGLDAALRGHISSQRSTSTSHLQGALQAAVSRTSRWRQPGQLAAAVRSALGPSARSVAGGGVLGGGSRGEGLGGGGGRSSSLKAGGGVEAGGGLKAAGGVVAAGWAVGEWEARGQHLQCAPAATQPPYQHPAGRKQLHPTVGADTHTQQTESSRLDC